MSGHEAGVVVLAVGPGTHRATRCKSGQVVSMKLTLQVALSHILLFLHSRPYAALQGRVKTSAWYLSGPISGPVNWIPEIPEFLILEQLGFLAARVFSRFQTLITVHNGARILQRPWLCPISMITSFPAPVLSVTPDAVKDLQGQDALSALWTSTF